MKILLPIDGSDFSEATIRMLIAQNQPSQTEVRVVHVVEPMDATYSPEGYPMDFVDLNEKRMQQGEKLAADAVGKLRAAGFQTTSSVPVGHVRAEIVDSAAQWGADLIVMGSHGRTGLERLLLGSVSDFVVRHAPCSVEVVRSRTRKG